MDRECMIVIFLLALLVPCLAQYVPGPQLPAVAVTNISFSPASPREDDTVRIMAVVASNQSLPVSNATVRFLVDQVELGNVTGVNLVPMGNTTVSIDWTAVKWDHVVTVTLDVGGAPLPGGMVSRVIRVEANPIGDLPTLAYALGLVIAFLLAIAAAPSFRARLVR